MLIATNDCNHMREVNLIDVMARQKPHAQQLSDYCYVKYLSRSQIAWEYLRRNPVYQNDWRISFAGYCKPTRLTDGTILLRVRRRFMRAEKWGLRIFRQSQPVSNQCGRILEF